MAAADYTGRIALGGNRIGKSDEGAYETMLAVTGTHPLREFPKVGKAWVIGTDYGKIRDINLPKFEKFVPLEWKAAGSHYNKQDKIWHMTNGERNWQVQFKSEDSGRQAFEGDAVDCIWFDEEIKEAIFTECMMRLIDKAGIWWMTATPILGTAWLLKTSKRDNVFSTFGATWDNPYLRAEIIADLSRDMSEEEKLVRIEGEYIIFGGRPVFTPVKALTDRMQDIRDYSPVRGMIEYAVI